MPLTAAQTQSVYEACGLKGNGGTFTIVRFDFYTTMSVLASTYPWTYANAKTAIDAGIATAIAVADGATRLGTHIATFDKWQPLRSVKLNGEVTFSAETEYQNAAQRIIDLVGVQVTPTPFGTAMLQENKGGNRMGRAER
jgi:hypothetical protein